MKLLFYNIRHFNITILRKYGYIEQLIFFKILMFTECDAKKILNEIFLKTLYINLSMCFITYKYNIHVPV